MLDYCESQRLLYAFGYGTNPALKQKISDLELEDNARLLWWMSGRKAFQMFHTFDDYQARSWPNFRKLVTKVEITQLNSVNVRFVVTNMNGLAKDIYQGFYSQRGNVPERPISELKNGLQMDRLSSPRFLANAHKLLTHMLAYALYVLFREANEATPELNKMEVSTARVRLFKVGALVQATHRHIWFRVASHWPGATLLTRAATAVSSYVTTTLERWRSQNLFADLLGTGTCNRSCITFAPLPLK